MTLTDKQSDQTMKVWNTYLENGDKYIYPATGFSHKVMDQHRLEIIPELKKLVDKFIYGSVTVEEFRINVDEINKKNLLWGFNGLNGQTFFNALAKTGQAAKRESELNNLFKETLPAPVNIEFAANNINTFINFTKALAASATDLLGAPRVAAIPYFLSYFYQIQRPEIWPVYYTTLIGELTDLEIWTPSEDLSINYAEFYELNFDMLDLIETKTGQAIKLWDLEHAFWNSAILREDQAVREPPAPVSAQVAEAAEEGKPKRLIHRATTFDTEPATVIISRKPSPAAAAEKKAAAPRRSVAKPFIEEAAPSFSESYIPPVVAILPALSRNDTRVAELCTQAGKTVEKVFQERLAVLFRMLGFETKSYARGQGRVPDGVAVCKEHHYAIIYDARVSRQGYSLVADDAEVREYVIKIGERLFKQGYRAIYFMVISSTFIGNPDNATRTLKIETGVNEVILVEVNSLMLLLENKLRDPELTLGPKHIQKLLAASGLLSVGAVRDFFGA